MNRGGVSTDQMAVSIENDQAATYGESLFQGATH